MSDEQAESASVRGAVHRSSFIVHRLISSLWLGSAFFLMLAASAAFRAAPNATAAADVVGAMLNRWHYIALVAPLVLFALELRRSRRFVLIVLFAGVLLAAAQILVDLQIRVMRTSSPVAISSLDRHHPLRKRFGALHGASMALLLLQAIAAAMVVAAREKKEDDTMSGFDPDREDTTIYNIVVNDEEIYAMWPADREMPPGWKEAGFQGVKSQCRAWITEHWTDMRPKSLRDKMGADTTGGGP